MLFGIIFDGTAKTKLVIPVFLYCIEFVKNSITLTAKTKFHCFVSKAWLYKVLRSLLFCLRFQN